jgi:hypothetical protein
MEDEQEGQTSFRSVTFPEYLTALVAPEQTMLDYFSTSGFYDPSCGNEVCAMSGRPRNSPDLL